MIKGTDVSVVIASIPGREDFLARAMASVEAQHTKPAEVIVQIDHERRGAWWCRNEAIKKVKTDWIAILDDDDEFMPNHLRTMVRGANLSGADLIFTYAKFVGGRDPLACCDDWGRLIAEPIDIQFGPAQERWLRRVGNYIPATVMMKTEFVREVGGYPEPNSMPEVRTSGECEDYLLLIKLLNAGAIFHHVCGVRTWTYHVHKTNTGGRGASRMHELDDPATVHQRGR